MGFGSEAGGFCCLILRECRRNATFRNRWLRFGCRIFSRIWNLSSSLFHFEEVRYIQFTWSSVYDNLGFIIDVSIFVTSAASISIPVSLICFHSTSFLQEDVYVWVGTLILHGLPFGHREFKLFKSLQKSTDLDDADMDVLLKL